MTPQSAILDPVPAHARHLFFELKPATAPLAALRALAAACDGSSAVLGIGAGVAAALGVHLPGLRAFPELPAARPAIPVTQHALWLWLRGGEPGDLLLQGHAVEALAAPAFTRVQAIDSFRHRDSRDLTGYEDGTENPKDEAAVEAAIAQGLGAGIDGSSFAAVQQWLHDFPTFDAMPRSEQDNCFGRRRSMPWVAGADAGLVFLAFGKSFDAYEAQLRRMTGHDDGISDALFSLTRPLTGGYYWCPPLGAAGVDLQALGL